MKCQKGGCKKDAVRYAKVCYTIKTTKVKESTKIALRGKHYQELKNIFEPNKMH